jgi:4-carboxymuconolactone decarboxylase
LCSCTDSGQPRLRTLRPKPGTSPPPDLTRDEAVAYDVAAALTGGGVLPELTYRTAVDAFGVHGAAELCYLVGLYCLVSVTLNGFDVPVPEPEEGPV